MLSLAEVLAQAPTAPLELGWAAAALIVGAGGTAKFLMSAVIKPEREGRTAAEAEVRRLNTFAAERLVPTVVEATIALKEIFNRLPDPETPPRRTGG